MALLTKHNKKRVLTECFSQIQDRDLPELLRRRPKPESFNQADFLNDDRHILSSSKTRFETYPSCAIQFLFPSFFIGPPKSTFFKYQSTVESNEITWI